MLRPHKLVSRYTKIRMHSTSSQLDSPGEYWNTPVPRPPRTTGLQAPGVGPRQRHFFKAHQGIIMCSQDWEALMERVGGGAIKSQERQGWTTVLMEPVASDSAATLNKCLGSEFLGAWFRNRYSRGGIPMEEGREKERELVFKERRERWCSILIEKHMKSALDWEPGTGR